MNWYNKYRPNSFDQVLGQDLVKSVLQNSLKSSRIKHGYLFSGPKGIGKTTLARIFASELNQLNTTPEASIDIIELDAASNTGIDNIRQLIDSSKTPPINAKYKIYIIDEVHMLSKSAMNALLKTLEEPPEYLVFLLATTNPEKLLPTVLSRLTKLNLSAHTKTDLIQNLTRIAGSENLKIDQESLELIAKRSSGSQRDAINLLETISSYDFDNVTIAQTSQILGILPSSILEKTLEALTTNSLDTSLINEIENLGFDGDTFLGQFLEYLIDTGFSSGNQFSNLIPWVAETISLKLPLTSPLTSLAVVQAKFLNNNLDIKKKSPKVTESDIKSNDNSESKVASQNVPAVMEAKSNSIEQPKEAQEFSPDETIKENLSIDAVSNIIKNSSKEKNSPPILKMLVANLNIAKLENSKVTLTTNNSIFLSQLSNPKILTFFKELIQINTGHNLEIEVILETKKNSGHEVVNYQEATSNEEFIPPQNEADLKSEPDFYPRVVENEPKITPKTPVKTTHEDKIFYQIYKSLPANVDPSLVKVYTDNLDPPQQEKADDWDDHAQSMFEFE